MTEELEVARTRWREAYEACDLSYAGIERKHGLPSSQMRGWVEGPVTPREKSRAKIEEVFMKLKETKRIPYHPSFGYATDEQIARLKESIPQQERDRIMKQIDKQTKLRGKID